MDWSGDATGRLYTATANGYQALIWQTSTGEWVALLSHTDVALAHTCCPSLRAAQAWCDAQVTAHRTGGSPAQRTA
jgi:hypothetical protein